MRRNPLFIFQNLSSIGIFDVPLKSTVHIIDAGDGYPKFIQLVAKSSVNSQLSQISTIADLLDDPFLYIDIAASSGSLSQLELIVENGLQGWRLYGRDPVFYGDIGDGAIDFSGSDDITPEVGGATGVGSFATGFETTAEGIHSFTAGNSTKTTGENSFAAGEFTIASGKGSSAFGIGTKISNEAATTIGRYNTGIEGAVDKTILEIGMGVDDLHRSNALEVYLSGDIIAPNLIVDPSKLKSLVTVEYLSGMNTESQLRLVNPAQEGWRLLSRNDANYGQIGLGSVDFSFSNAPSGFGATGNYAFAEGDRVQADGNYSHAEGQLTLAENDAGHAEGIQTRAIGEAAHAEGYSTTALGNRSHAEGSNTLTEGENSHAGGILTVASGRNSFAHGDETLAIGENSFSIGKLTNARKTNTLAAGLGSDAEGVNSFATGYYTKAVGDNSTALGQHNVGLLNTTTILEVGIGTNSTMTANALEVHKDGVVRAPEFTLANVANHLQNLITLDYFQNNGGTSQLERIDSGIAPGCTSMAATDAGYRILGRNDNTTNYATIGCSAVDLSYSDAIAKGASGRYSFATGRNVLASGIASQAAGTYTMAVNESQTVVGQYNEIDTAGTSVFEVGVGASDAVRANGLVIDYSGNVTAPEMAKLTTTAVNAIGDSALITLKYFNDNNASGGGGEQSQLALTDSGWALLDRDSTGTLYGVVGLNSVDLSTSNTVGTYGATGESSFSVGLRTSATAMTSFSEGTDTLAGAENAHAAGLGTIADNIGQFVVGSYNDIANLSKFVVGVGSLSTKANALEVYDNGAVRAPSMLLSNYTSVTPKYLTTKEYVDTAVIPGSIGTLSDVDITAPVTADDVLTWDTVSSMWIPKSIATASFTERGGVAYDSNNIDYFIGDIVTDTGINETYLCIANYTSTATPPSSDAANWQKASTLERGGVAYVGGSVGYVIGDVVTEGSVAYVCTAAFTPAVDWATDSANFTPIDTPAGNEIGGKMRQPTTDYKIGDVVTAYDGSVYGVYYAINDFLSGDDSPGNEFSDELTAGDWVITSPIESFLDLPDTPNAYNAGDAGKVLIVNPTEDGLEYGTSTSATGLFYDIASSGWRLLGREDGILEYGAIGIYAIDFNRSDGSVVTIGATGQDSVAFGVNNLVSGENSTGFGNNLTVDGDNQFVVGQYNDTSDASFVVGTGISGTTANAFEVNGTTNPGGISAPLMDLTFYNGPTLTGFELATTDYVKSITAAGETREDYDVIIDGETDFELGGVGANIIVISVIDVWLNGTKLREGAAHDYVINTSTKTEVVVNGGLMTDDWIQIGYKY